MRTGPLEAPPWVLVALIAGAAVLSVPRVTWRWFGLYVTFVHELGHAFAALMAGHRISGIELRFDHSGQMRSLGRGGIGAVWAGFWGYPVPAVTGLALIWAASQGWATASLSLGVLVLAAALLFIRNLQGLAIAAGCAAAAVLLIWFVPAELAAYAVVTLGIALVTGAVRDWINLLSVHTRRRHALSSSDAWILAQRTGIPGALWLTAFALVIAVSAAGSLWLLASL
ncbi:M50 family metallopeptidase [Arthrobacter sp. Sa2BUA2]|uniref:M50 family metallopeptidase n=2 Tax=Arthrobacter pullicola TaxID=2762224 RepID=A0ABR8YM52_9MICC|nr:M50 family metallopeptidase [Arthrobacter pullicola]